MTPSATSDARRAAAHRSAGDIRAVRARKIGTAPGGSMMTMSVMSVDAKTATAAVRLSLIAAPEPRRSAGASISASTAGSVRCSPSRLSLPAPW